MKQTMNIMTIDDSIIPLIGTFEQLENNCNNAIVIDSIPFNSFGNRHKRESTDLSIDQSIITK